MTYARIDDNHAEALALVSDKAFRVHFRGRLFCARMLSDGKVPARTAHEWGPRSAVTELVGYGWWVAEGDHYFIPSHVEDGNPTKAQVEERRRQDSERKRSGFQTEGDTDSERIPRTRSRTPTPAPTPEPPPAPELQDPEAPQAASNGNGKSSLARTLDALNLGLVESLWSRYPSWAREVSFAFLQSLTTGSEKRRTPAFGAKAVNAAIDDLYANADGVSNPAGYLRERAEAHADQQPVTRVN